MLAYIYRRKASLNTPSRRPDITIDRECLISTLQEAETHREEAKKLEQSNIELENQIR